MPTLKDALNHALPDYKARAMKKRRDSSRARFYDARKRITQRMASRYGDPISRENPTRVTSAEDTFDVLHAFSRRGIDL